MKISDLPEATYNWFKNFEFDTGKEITETQLAPPSLNANNYGTPIWDHPPLVVAILYNEKKHAEVLIKNGALQAYKDPGYLYNYAFEIQRHEPRIEMIKLLLQHTPLTDKIMTKAQEKFDDDIIESLGKQVLSYFWKIEPSENLKTLKFLQEEHSKRLKLETYSK